MRLEKLGPVGPGQKSLQVERLKVRHFSRFEVGVQKQLLVFRRALAFVRDHASAGRGEAGVASSAPRLGALVQLFLSALHGVDSTMSSVSREIEFASGEQGSENRVQ